MSDHHAVKERAATEKLTECPVCLGHELKSLDQVASICQCSACGFIFRNPRPGLSEIAQYYSREAQYENWLAHEVSRNGLWVKRLRMLSRYGRRGRLLDVGAGIGQFLDVASDDYE